MLHGFKQFATKMHLQLKTLYLVSRHPELPVAAKWMALIVVGYALSPIDLIPDFIPIIGYLDELILLPIGIYLTTRLIPKTLWNACQQQVNTTPLVLPVSRVAARYIFLIWLCLGSVVSYGLWHYFNLS